MPWFKIDDGFHCHAKVFAAGTPAAGLYVRCGSWAAQQSSDGVVPKAVAKQYGTPRMIKALIDVGLWHQKGHSCDTCPAVDAGSYLIHQYLQKNPSRAENDEARKAKSERQQRWREGKRQAGEDADVDASTSGGRSGHDANSEANSHRVGTNLNANSHRVEDELASSWGADSEKTRSAETGSSQFNWDDASSVDADVDASTRRHGDAAPSPSRPVPSPVSPNGDTAAAARGGLPDQLGDLKRGIAAAGLAGIGWDLKPSQLEYSMQAMSRVGVAAMVAYAINSARLKGVPAGASAWVQGWRSLEAPPENGVSYLPALAAGGSQPTSHNASVIARARARRQQQP